MHLNVASALVLAVGLSLAAQLVPSQAQGDNNGAWRNAQNNAEQAERRSNRIQRQLERRSDRMDRKQSRKPVKVPEPATLALLSLGIGGLVAGSAWWKRS